MHLVIITLLARSANSHVVAVAEEKLSHILDCVGWVLHVRSPDGSLEHHFDVEAQPSNGATWLTPPA
jgi:hypothetical protein